MCGVFWFFLIIRVLQKSVGNMLRNTTTSSRSCLNCTEKSLKFILNKNLNHNWSLFKPCKHETVSVLGIFTYQTLQEICIEKGLAVFLECCLKSRNGLLLVGFLWSYHLIFWIVFFFCSAQRGLVSSVHEREQEPVKETKVCCIWFCFFISFFFWVIFLKEFIKQRAKLECEKWVYLKFSR